MIITISSSHGAGASTVAKLLAKKLNYRHISGGKIWDEIALEKKTDVIGLNLLAEKDKKIDLELDNKIIELAKTQKNTILEASLSGWQCFKNKIPALKIWLTCPLKTRVERIAHREHKTYAQSLAETGRREQSEGQRFRQLYSIDTNDVSLYDLNIDSSRFSPEEIAEIIIKKVKTYGLN